MSNNKLENNHPPDKSVFEYAQKAQIDAGSQSIQNRQQINVVVQSSTSKDVNDQIDFREKSRLNDLPSINNQSLIGPSSYKTSPRALRSTKTKKLKSSRKKKQLTFFIKFKLGKKQYDIDFKYNMDEDNPQKIANEMKDLLNLPAEKIETIREQIEKVVSTQLLLQENKKKQKLLKLIEPV